MKHIVSYSGGAASFAAAHLAVEKPGKENVLLVFCDTLIEDVDLYRFIREGQQALGCEFIRLSDGRNPWEVFRDRKYQGNTRTAHCTVELKGKTFAKWLSGTFQPGECTIHFGFDWTEGHRLAEARKNWAPYDVEALLCAPPYLSKAQVNQIIDDYDIELPRLYGLGFVHNNCGGFCVKAGQAHYETLLRELPDVYAWHEAQQEQLMVDVPTVRPFLRIVRNKVKHYLTLRQYREHLQSGGEFDAFEYGGCGCFSDASGGDLSQLIATDSDYWAAYII